ncbi:MAG: DUF1284 domain-containing protein [Chloroflexi bacterium]|nr:DUF1284 domain-containing protein [Chloroflexota bacterium]
MSQIQARLRADPQVMVEVKASPDAICQPCPHLGSQGCRQHDSGSEGRVARRDGHALRALKLRRGQNVPWSQIQEQLRRFLIVSGIEEVCRDCQWLSLGYCQEEASALKAAEQKVLSNI